MPKSRQVGIETDHLRCKTDCNEPLRSHRREISMSRIRHCLECPNCRLRYVISRSPYRNGSRIVAAIHGGHDEYILYCSCRRGASRWIEQEVLRCDVSDAAYERGFGTRAEIRSPCRIRLINGPSDGRTVSVNS